VRFASEDVGLADPQALSVALASWRLSILIGRPEGDLALAEAAVFLANGSEEQLDLYGL